MLKSKIKCSDCKFEGLVPSEKFNHKDEVSCPKCSTSLIYIKNIYFKQQTVTTNLAASSFTHPLDKKALKTLSAVPGLSAVTKIMMKYSYEMYVRVNQYGDNIRVTDKTCSYINDMAIQAATILGVNIPEVFITQNPIANAFTTCVDKPIIVLHSGLIELLDDEELYTVMAHEMGHIKCEHVLYHMLASFISNFPDILGLAKLLAAGINIALLEWHRKSELSADRAALIVSGNKGKVISTLLKLAGGSSRLMNMIEFSDFASQYNEYEQLMESGGHKMMHRASTLFRSHPFPIIRAHEIDNWEGIGSDVIGDIEKIQHTCGRCNFPLNEGSKFCQNCGNKITDQSVLN